MKANNATVLSEAQIQRQIMDMLKRHIWVGHVSRVNVSGVPLHGKGQQGKYRPAPNKGMSDIIGVLKGGRFFAVEVKSAKGRLTPEQRVYLDAVDKAGGLALVARSVDDVKEAFKQAGMNDRVLPPPYRDALRNAACIDGSQQVRMDAVDVVMDSVKKEFPDFFENNNI